MAKSISKVLRQRKRGKVGNGEVVRDWGEMGESWECMFHVRNILQINWHNQNMSCRVVVLRQGIHRSCKCVNIMSMVRIYMYMRKSHSVHWFKKLWYLPYFVAVYLSVVIWVLKSTRSSWIEIFYDTFPVYIRFYDKKNYTQLVCFSKESISFK